jgi:hypothetical protein
VRRPIGSPPLSNKSPRTGKMSELATTRHAVYFVCPVIVATIVDDFNLFGGGIGLVHFLLGAKRGDASGGDALVVVSNRM